MIKKTRLTVLMLIALSLKTFAIQLSENEKNLTKRDVKAKNGIVVSANPIASKVGLEILKKGGNAVDAAVGVAFTLGLVEPFASGPGGGGYMLLKEQDNLAFYDYGNIAPSKMTIKDWEEIYDDKKRLGTGEGSLVPGAVAGWLTALEEHGSMKIGDILEPVIKLAESGFEVAPTFANVIQDSYGTIEKSETAQKVFFNDGFPYTEGEIYINLDYANTLKAIAKSGKDGFYKGEVADAIVKANPWISKKDLESYKPLKMTPVSGEYRDYTVVTAGPSSAGVAILETLNIVENYDLKKIGLENPYLYHIWAEAMNLSNADRSEYIADSRYVENNVKVLSSQEFANERNKMIKKDKALNKVNAGPLEYESPSTTHVSIIDKNGNAVSMTNTIGNFFGCGEMPENSGFMLNSSMSLFSREKTYPINKFEPGKRPRSTMSPTMVLNRDKSIRLVVGTPGASRILSTTPWVISNVLDHGMDIQTAIDYPRIEKYRGVLSIEGGVSDQTILDLKEKGHEIVNKEKNDLFFGGVHAISLKEEMHGAADTRRDGKALGY